MQGITRHGPWSDCFKLTDKESFMNHNRVWISTTILLLACTLSAVAQTGNTITGEGALPNDSGTYNTADGYQALYTNNGGAGNTAVGSQALLFNVSGGENTAIGIEALYGLGVAGVASGYYNTAIGYEAGTTMSGPVTAGSNNTYLGSLSGSATNLTNATAIGARAEVQESNAMVLGSINTVNGATASTNVGIGTTTPQATLDINGNNGNMDTLIGAACNGNKNFAGVAFAGTGLTVPISTAFQNCTNYALLGDINGNTYINAPDGEIAFRIGNVTNAMTISNNGNVTIPGTLTVGSMSNGSDRNLKENFAPVDGANLLTKLNAIPMQTWKYKTDSPSIRHLGPMAQDFRAAFGLGEDDKHISTIDEGGVALAAVQELYREGLKKDATIRHQNATIRHLQAQIKAQQSAAKIQQAQIEQLAAQVKMVQAALPSSGQPVTATRTVAQLASVR